MSQLDDEPTGFDADAAAAWEAYRTGIWQEVGAGRLTPELGQRLCDTLSMVAWFQGYQAGRREPLRLP